MGTISQYFVGIPGGLLMSVIAFSTVFLVIVGLMLMMMALKKFSAAVAVKEREKAAAATSAEPVQAQTATTPQRAVSVEDDSELIVAITAAITAMTGTAARVVSFKPAAPHTSGSAWRMTGILQNSEGFAN